MERQLYDKFSPNWLRPYIIKRNSGLGTYHLIKTKSNEEHELINIMHLHPFYS